MTDFPTPIRTIEIREINGDYTVHTWADTDSTVGDQPTKIAPADAVYLSPAAAENVQTASNFSTVTGHSFEVTAVNDGGVVFIDVAEDTA